MAEDIPRQVFEIKELPTKSITLYPSRAHVVREIRDVVLEPGPNEIEVYGLTPSTDEQSVQIDGKGAATITDLTVELVPNKYSYEDEYPDEDEELSEAEILPYEDSDDEREDLRAISKAIKELSLQKEQENETQRSSWKQLEALGSHMKTLDARNADPAKLAEFLKVYNEQRSATWAVYSKSQENMKDIEKKIKRKEHELQVASKDERKRKLKEANERQKQKDKELRKKVEKAREAQRVKTERVKFWPKQVYKVTLRLETASLDTPASSRRNSMDAVTLTADRPLDKVDGKALASSGERRTVTISLSYVTTEASWTPRYDISISSLQKTAIITYRGEFTNQTSETWKDAKIILSTSQTSYSGLDDKPPTLGTWSIKLGRYQDTGDGGLYSSAEITRRPQQHYLSKAKAMKKNRADFFGAPAGAPQSGANAAQSNSLFGAQQVGSSNATGYVQPWMQSMAQQSVQQSIPMQQAQQQPMRQQQAAVPNSTRFYTDVATDEPHRLGAATIDSLLERGENLAALDPQSAAFDFEEAEWEDNGLTATYEVPGTRTLSPSSLSRRHKIASLTCSAIHLSYISIPKLRSTAYLRAKLRNPSNSVTLLKGQAGITLDSSFLGNLTLPRVSPSQLFTLSLGTDPGIHVSYPKPAVRRSTQGLFNKESSHLFSRSIWITNTKPQPVELLVLDQIPVSQDERLRVDIVQPKGLNKEGDAVRAGQSAKAADTGAASTAVNEKWGKAVVQLKKNGEVAWTVNVEKGAAVLLKLEYEARMPNAESIVNA